MTVSNTIRPGDPVTILLGCRLREYRVTVTSDGGSLLYCRPRGEQPPHRDSALEVLRAANEGITWVRGHRLEPELAVAMAAAQALLGMR